MGREEDAYWGRTWKVGFNSVAGDPYATEDEVAKKGYGEIFASQRPETAGEALQRTEALKQDWRETAREVDTTGVGGAVNEAVGEAAGGSPAPEAPLDDGERPRPEGGN
jgi:hypothetical protein